jgi:hypothetical protein
MTAAGVLDPPAPLLLDAAFMDGEAGESVVEAEGESARARAEGPPVRSAVRMMVKTIAGLM